MVSLNEDKTITQAESFLVAATEEGDNVLPLRACVVVDEKTPAKEAEELIKGLLDLGCETQVLADTSLDKGFLDCLEVLSGAKVLLDIFDERKPGEITHIALAKESFVFIVLCGGQEFFEAFGQGLADTMPRAVYLATTAPILIQAEGGLSAQFGRTLPEQIDLVASNTKKTLGRVKELLELMKMRFA